MKNLIEQLEARKLLAADFTLAALSDSQYIVESFPTYFAAQTQWLADNAANPAHNIAFMAHQGDMLRRGYSNAQAAVADDALDRLNGIVPYTVSIGNHDYDNQFDDLDHHVSSANFAAWFGDARYQAIANSGFAGSSLDQRNRYHLFTAGDQQYMVLSLEWAAPDSSLAWAQNVINANPNIPIILSTHEYLNSAGRTTSTLDPIGNSGSALWSKLVNINPQIFLVLGGHTGVVRHQTSINAAGLPVHEAAVDFEGVKPNGGNGFMQLFHFLPDQNQISVSSYSPVTGQSDTSSSTYAFDLPLDFSTRFNFSNTPVPFNPFSNTPIALEDSATVDEGESVTINAVANDIDPDGDTIKAVLSSLPANGAVYVNPDGTFTYTPDPKFVGVDTFNYYPIDDAVRGAETTVTINVTDTDARYAYPIAETTTTGTRTGSYLNLAASDNILETLTGSVSHRWQFNIAGGEQNTFAINAWRDWDTNEYKLQYSTNGSTYFDMTRIVTAGSLSVTRTGFDAAEPYQMWRLPTTLKGTVYVRPVNTDSGALGWSIKADEMFIMSTGAVPVTPVPAAPTNLTATYSKSKRKATLKWRDSATTETGYRVWYSTNNGATWSVYATLGANATSHTTNALTRGVTYQFKISAFNTGGDSLFSNTVTVFAT